MERLLKLLLICCFCCSGSAASDDLGTISGKLVDTKGVPVPAATIRLASPDQAEMESSMETLSNWDGSFAFDNLPDTAYKLEVRMPGFQSLVVEEVQPSLELRTWVLSSPAPPQPKAQPEERSRLARSERRGGNGQGRRAGAFPRNNGGFETVEMSDFSAERSAPLDLGESFGANPEAEQESVLIISGNPTVSMGSGDFNDPDFRRRMMEQANQLGFRSGGFRRGGPGGGGPGGGGPGGGGSGFGRFGGGRFGRGSQAPINGSLSVTYQNSAMNARPYSLTGKEIPQPLQIHNQFGISVGGVLPGASSSGGSGGPGRGRMGRRSGSWFFSYEGRRNREPFDVLTTVPTPLERSGDFSQTLQPTGPLSGTPVTIYDPFSGSQASFPDNRIPESRIDPAALALLEYIPAPNLPGTVQNYAFQRGLPNNSDSLSARVNTRLFGNTVFFNYSHRTSDRLSSQAFPGLDTLRENSSHNVTVGGIYRNRRRILVNYRVNFNHVSNRSINPFAFQDDVAGRLGITGVSNEPVNWGIPNTGFTNYGGLQLGNPARNRFQTILLGGGLSKIGTVHTIRSGIELSWVQRNTQEDPNARGTFDYTGYATSAFDAKARPIAGTGYDLADFLLGFPYESSRRFGSSNNYLRARNWNFYIQDDWRARANLTVNVGLRYEYLQPFYEKFDQIVTLDAAPDFTAVEQVFPGDSGTYSGVFPRSLLHSDKNNFAPRIGIAWKRKPDSKWVFRAGWGLFYNPSVYDTIAGQLIGQPPFATNQNLLSSRSNLLTIQNGFPENPDVTILNSYAIDPSYRIGYVHQWNLTVQAPVFRIYTLEVGYNGSKGTRLDILRAPNRAPSGGSPIDTEDDRGIENAGNFVYQQIGANSILHSMRVRLVRRFSSGSRFDATYTLAKSIDNASGLGGGRLVVVQDEKNFAAERSLSSFDQRHRFQANFSFDLPFGDRRKFFANASPLTQVFVAGWTLTGSYQLFSGTPLTPRILGNVSNNSGTGSNSSERPDRTGVPIELPASERTTAQHFNTAAFAVPAPGTFGNAARYVIPGPGSNLLNVTLRKSFRLDDQNRRLDFRWQITNVLNQPNFAGLGTVVNAQNYGRVTGTRPMRVMQFRIRINF